MAEQEKRSILPAALLALAVVAGGGFGAYTYFRSPDTPAPKSSAEATAYMNSVGNSSDSLGTSRTAVPQSSSGAPAVSVTPLGADGSPLAAQLPTTPNAVQDSGTALSPDTPAPSGVADAAGADATEATATDPTALADGLAAASGAAGGAASGLRADALGRDDTPTTGMLMPPREKQARASAAEPARRESGREDSVVRGTFVDDLAAFLARNYWPRGTHPSARKAGISTVSMQWANLRYGAEMPGIRGGDGSPARARASVLRYVLAPATVKSLYNMYGDRFIKSLQTMAAKRTVGAKGNERHLTAAEKKEMYSIYAARAAFTGNALKRYAADPSIPAKVRAHRKAADAVDAARKAYLERVEGYEGVRQGGGRQQTATAKASLERAAGVYQESIRTRENAKKALVSAMGGTGRGGDALVYIASWAERRGDGKSAALAACGDAALAMSAKLRAVAK